MTPDDNSLHGPVPRVFALLSLGSTVTWVVGTPTMLGYATAISDIRVTWPDGRSRDCLLKVYPVGRYIAAGFAGSVEFGFWAVVDLQRQLATARPDGAWRPGRVAFWWYRDARRQFAHAPDDVRKLGASIMLLGVSPDVDIGIPGWARATVAIMHAPDFFPRVLQTNAVESIGSGRGVDIYSHELRRLSEDRQMWQAEVGTPGGYAWMLQHAVERTVARHPEATVSPHVHSCLVRRGEIRISTSDHDEYEGGNRIEIRMPRVAQSWAEFCDLVSVNGSDPAGAGC